MTPAADFTQLNISGFLNGYYDVQRWYLISVLSPVPSSCPAPIINNFSGNGKFNAISISMKITFN